MTAKKVKHSMHEGFGSEATTTAEEFSIEKGLPMPRGKGLKHHFPFDSMEIGDSFSVAKNAVSSLRFNVKKQSPRKFTVRRISDDQFRCWRTE